MLTLFPALDPRPAPLRPRVLALGPRPAPLRPRVLALGPRPAPLRPRVLALGPRPAPLRPRVLALGPRRGAGRSLFPEWGLRWLPCLAPLCANLRSGGAQWLTRTALECLARRLQLWLEPSNDAP